MSRWCYGFEEVAYGRNDTMKDLHQAGFTKENILDALRVLPFVSRRNLPPRKVKVRPDPSSTPL